MHKVKAVEARDDFRIALEFEDGRRKVFDVTPYLDRGIFRRLRDPEYFRRVRVFLGSVAWPDGQDFDPDHLYAEGA